MQPRSCFRKDPPSGFPEGIKKAAFNSRFLILISFSSFAEGFLAYGSFRGENDVQKSLA